jgi:hypothetical protein
MFYLRSDQHARQLTISLRDDAGDECRLGKSRRERNRSSLFAKLTPDRARDDEAFMAVVEVCGFNGWLIWQSIARGSIEVIAKLGGHA